MTQEIIERHLKQATDKAYWFGAAMGVVVGFVAGAVVGALAYVGVVNVIGFMCVAAGWDHSEGLPGYVGIPLTILGWIWMIAGGVHDWHLHVNHGNY